MSSARLAVAAAVTAVLAWGLKAVAIAVAGGLDRSPLEGPLFFLGLVAVVVAFVAAGVAATRGRSAAVRALGGVAGFLVGLALSALVASVVGALVPESAGWVQEEAGLWAVGLLAVGLTALVARRRDRRLPA